MSAPLGRLVMLACALAAGCEPMVECADDTCLDASVGQGGGDAGARDAGDSADSGASVDAGALSDAGLASLDAGTSSDGGRLSDAGSSNDAGPNDAGRVDAGVRDAGLSVADAGRPVFVAVGYEGVRVSSTDLGLTWSAPQKLGPFGDNEFLLRGVGFGNGLFVAVGWKIYVSSDGQQWQQRAWSGNWLQGIQYAFGRFVATGGYGQTASSDDGLTWGSRASTATQANRSLAFSGSTLMSATDPGVWWRSTDGLTWTQDSTGHASNEVVWCQTSFQEEANCTVAIPKRSTAFGRGVWVRARQGHLERSLNGTQWTALNVPNVTVESVAFGVVP